MILCCVMRARTKNQRNKSKTNQQASRKTTPPPEKLKAIIDLVNSIPPETELPDVQKIWEQINQQALDDFQNWYESRRQEVEGHKHQLGPQTDSPEYTARLLEYVQMQVDFADDQIARTDAVVDAIGRGIAAVNLCLEGLSKCFDDHRDQPSYPPRRSSA